MPTPLEKFQSLLRELFQFEQADLDFGVYRIMNLRRERMEKWLNEELPARARAILAQGGTTADDDLGARLEALKADIVRMDPGGIDEDGNIVNEALKGIAKGKEYLKLKAQADRAPARTAAGMEPLVYNHLYDFFSRYYDTGDFIPKRRRSFAPDGRDTYAIPWDGEEVVLHWANKDQYYIKTGERFTHYRWQSEASGRTFTVEFRLTDADLPPNNNKDAKKKFNLLVEDKVEWQEDKATLILPFHYRELTPEQEGQFIGTQEAKLRESIIKRTVDTLREMPAITGVPQLATALMAPKRDAAGQEKRDKEGNAVPLLPHHLNRWAVKNESDFFIHKDLRRFLSGELDYFLKSVVLNLDNLLAAGEQRAEPNFRLLDAVKCLGSEIVDFVSHLEDFQKALFEKKKFVLETSWCLTLDRIPASMKEEVYAAILANDWQWEEWETLYKISQWPADLVTVTPRTREFLEAYPFLILDTGLRNAGGGLAYAASVIDGIFAGISDVEEQTNGTLIHSENLQALNLLQERYRSGVDCNYIDPPYNTGPSEILYKNAYKHSSWAAMVYDRAAAAMKLLTPKATKIAAIDDNEVNDYCFILSGLSEAHKLTLVTIVTNPKGSITKDFNRTHDYALFLVPTAHKVIERTLEENDTPRKLRRWGENSLRTDRPKSFYPIYVKNGKVVRYGPVPANDFHPNAKNILKPNGEIEIWPLEADGTERRWNFGRDSVGSNFERIVAIDDEGVLDLFVTHELSVPKSVWKGGEFDAGKWGNTLLIDILGEKRFDYPKSIHTVVKCLQTTVASNKAGVVLDYFGGSGTTGHAVVQMNRTDGDGQRKYVLVEMGNHFVTVVKPRMQKVVFSETWKEGRPVRQANPANPNNPYNGVSHCIKVIRLESYEDALDNIEFNSGAAPGAELGLDFSRDYELRYALDWESKDCPTRLALAQLDTPFDYTLTLRRESGTVDVKPDLPETFAYLIGLHTRRRFRTERDGVSYLIYTGTLHADGTEVAVLWRTCKGWTEAHLKAEMDWWRDQRETFAPGATRVYVNGASAIEGHHSLDAEFKMRMHGGAI
jgi:adenine-specific DNA-methyltransferase